MLLIYYMIAINLIAFIFYGIDKRKAIKGSRRIPEKTLILLVVIGGAFGGFLGMKLFHHKTQKKKFYITVPVFMVLYLAVIIFCVWQKCFV
ncbi:MAG: DUF1294 domain-containing protein [Eubacterium sp.]|nr:DUF1294 domain-containing protein [Eubacterium sp.]